MRPAILFALGSLLAFHSSRSLAWNEVGHAVIAKIAYEELGKENPKLQLRLLELLKKHPHYEEYLANNQPEGANPAEWALLRASNWADWIRPPFNNAVKPVPGRVRYHRAFDHFINIPVVTKDGPHTFIGKIPAFDPDRPDILGAFRQRMGELSETLAAPEDKAVALCWIAHLVGDIHQPLHAASRISKQFPDGDLGGNRFGVCVEGRPVRLHAYWDNILGEVPGWQVDTSEHQARVYALVAQVADSLREPKYSRTSLADDLRKNTTFASWIEESHGLAETVAYRNGAKWLEAAAIPARGSVPQVAPEVGTGYHQLAQETGRRRVSLAGYRLADKLRLILSRQ